MVQAVEFVIQQEAMLAMSKARKLSPTDGSAGKVTPLAELIELMETYGENELPHQEKVTQLAPWSLSYATPFSLITACECVYI